MSEYADDEPMNPSRALVLWKPKHLFLPPVQEPPPPSRVFRHIDLEMEGEKKRSIYFTDPNEKHTPDHEIALPELILNDTFRRLIYGIPRTITYRPYSPATRPPSYASTLPNQDVNKSQVHDYHQRAFHDDNSMEESPIPPPKKKRPLTSSKIVLKRKSPEPQHQDIFGSPGDLHQLPVKKHKTSINEIEEDASIEQWRVGKRPGHQGSFRTPNILPDEPAGAPASTSQCEKKRSLSQSIASSAERVLKKPFRPPTRILPLKSATKRARSSSPPPQQRMTLRPSSPPALPTHRSTHTSSSITTSAFKSPLPGSSTTHTLTDPPLPDFLRKSPNSNRRLTRPNKAFKTPSRSDRSPAPFISTSTNRSARNASGNSQAQAQVASLQNEILMLKKAIKYDEEDDETHLHFLVHQWRNAGRDIVERLFELVPRPEHQFDQQETKYSSQKQASHGTNSWTDQGRVPPTPTLTRDQLDYIRNAPTNEDGEPVDEEGDPLIPDMEGTDEEMKKVMIGLLEKDRYGQEKYKSHWSSQSSNFDTNTSGNYPTSTTSRPQADRNEWNFASLMQAMGVDPSLLGWNNDTEDWIEYSISISQESLD
ncbi:hypothetical protein CI109_105641 [Kwoniella shandongensis]|uniref:Uncharacterized protein n=1 Tax=Kwoniella shandongensis TaxID=1734106 RepID=A0A5M6C6P0_9TREE|nr:uncharacterized protein CI109_002357 [Kwoniella shandongensis]KAA5529462.1 hypothetical protein CI109_002357 [Kwoniella shandongensis]